MEETEPKRAKIVDDEEVNLQCRMSCDARLATEIEEMRDFVNDVETRVDLYDEDSNTLLFDRADVSKIATPVVEEYLRTSGFVVSLDNHCINAAATEESCRGLPETSPGPRLLAQLKERARVKLETEKRMTDILRELLVKEVTRGMPNNQGHFVVEIPAEFTKQPSGELHVFCDKMKAETGYAVWLKGHPAGGHWAYILVKPPFSDAILSEYRARVVRASMASASPARIRYMKPLRTAIRDKQYSQIDLLLSKGADLSQVGDESMDAPGETFNTSHVNPHLHFAVVYGETDMVAYLLKKGAQVNQVNSKQATALDLATDFRLAPKIEILKQHGGLTREALKKKELEDAA